MINYKPAQIEEALFSVTGCSYPKDIHTWDEKIKQYFSPGYTLVTPHDSDTSLLGQIDRICYLYWHKQFKDHCFKEDKKDSIEEEIDYILKNNHWNT